MASHSETLKQRYQQFSGGDVQGAISNWTDDFTWQGTGEADLPGGGVHHGRDEAIRVLGEAVGAWDEFTLHVDEFFEDGDTVVVLGHNHVRKGDRSAELPVVHVWRFRDGQPYSLGIVTDSLTAARLLGRA